MEHIKAKNQERFAARRLTRIGILGAIAILMSLTPIGYIPIPGLKITFMHVPVIIAAIMEGLLGGVTVGLIFGITSLVINLSGPFATVFINPMVSVLPRIMIGVVSYYVYKKTKNAAITAAAGTLTNTVGVLSMIYVFAMYPYAKAYANLNHISVESAVGTLGKILAAIGLTNGSLEIIAAVLIVSGVMRALRRIV